MFSEEASHFKTWIKNSLIFLTGMQTILGVSST